MVELTSRQRELVRKLCRETTFCTVADLARSVDASARTVRSDLRSVESFMAQHGAALERSPGRASASHVHRKREPPCKHRPIVPSCIPSTQRNSAPSRSYSSCLIRS